MNGVIENDKINSLRSLHEEDETARRFLDWGAARINDSVETSVDRAVSVTRASAPEVRRLFQEFQKLGLGELKTGRKGYKTRFIWNYSLRSIGKISKRQSQSLEDIDVTQVEPPDEDPALAPQAQAEVSASLVTHAFQLRPDLLVKLPLPQDLTTKDVERLSSWMRSLPFE
jgi:hypothetical protein